MSKPENKVDELRPEYSRDDFGTMTRGKYTQRIRESSNIVVLDPDIAAAFPTSESVNQALRQLLELARSSVHLAE